MKRFGTLILALSLSSLTHAADSFKTYWSIYVGWMPWAYGAEQGIVKKWADKYGIGGAQEITHLGGWKAYMAQKA